MAENLVYKTEDIESSLNSATADSVVIKTDALAVIAGEQDINVAKAEAIGIATVIGASDKIAAIKAAETVAKVAEALTAVETGWSVKSESKETEDETP